MSSGKNRPHQRVDPLVSDALRDQSLLARWYEKRDGKKYMTDFSQWEGALAPVFQGIEGLREYGAFADFERHTLLDAETYAITPDMHKLIMQLQEGTPGDTLPSSIALHELPAMSGFVRLPEAITIDDRHGHPYNVRAMAWRYPVGVRIRGIPNCEDESHYWDRVMSSLYVENPAPHDSPHERMPGPHISLLHFAPMTIEELGVLWQIPNHLASAAQYLALFWLIANQELSRIESIHLPPGSWTAMQAREAKIVPKLRIVSLRRERIDYVEPEVHSEREYSHRWVVRAHWRNQAYGPGRQDHKWVLVNAHVKGPDDKPLIVKQRAYLLEK